MGAQLAASTLNMTSNQKILKIIDVLALLLLFVIFIPASFNRNINSFCLYYIIPCLTLFAIVKVKGKAFPNPYFKILTYLFLWICLTAFFARDLGLASAELKRMLGVFLFCYIISSITDSEKFICWLYFLYIVKFFYIFFYAVSNLNLFEMDIVSERFSEDDLNANTLGYFSFFATFSSFMLSVVLSGWKKKLAYLSIFLCVVLAVVASFYTASRQILLIQGILLINLLFIKYFLSLNMKSVFFILAIAITIPLITPYWNHYYENSFLQSRNQLNIKEDTRVILIKEAIELGMENPILGVGPGNFLKHSNMLGFSHSSYTELFANSGILALLLYLFIFIKLIVTLMQLHRKNKKDKLILFFSAFVVVYVIYNVLYVFYLNLFLLGFLFLIIAHISIHKKEYLKERLVSTNASLLLKNSLG